MIRYDMRCRKGHVFEGWFRDSTAFDEQLEDGDLRCPTCGSRKVEKALMAPALAKSNTREAKAAEMRKALVELRRQVETNSDYVGERFAEEARRIHYGEVDPRSIHGEASDEEAEALTEEGVEFARIPWLRKESA